MCSPAPLGQTWHPGASRAGSLRQQPPLGRATEGRVALGTWRPWLPPGSVFSPAQQHGSLNMDVGRACAGGHSSSKPLPYPWPPASGVHLLPTLTQQTKPSSGLCLATGLLNPRRGPGTPPCIDLGLEVQVRAFCLLVVSELGTPHWAEL